MNKNDMCYCSTNTGLFVPNRQLSWAVAGIFLLLFCSFIIGYFWGKKSAVEQFGEKMHQELNTALNTTNAVLEDKNIVHENIINEDIIVRNEELSTAIVASVATETDSMVAQETTQLDSEIKKQQFYAQLIGFGTEKAAQKFVHKLAQRNIETYVKKRPSKTAQGRTIHWYQVVTPAFDNKEALTVLVNQLVKEERLSGISIRSC